MRIVFEPVLTRSLGFSEAVEAATVREASGRRSMPRLAAPRRPFPFRSRNSGMLHTAQIFFNIRVSPEDGSYVRINVWGCGFCVGDENNPLKNRSSQARPACGYANERAKR